MRKILISIKPKYVQDILLGKKLYEYRKRLPSDVDAAIIYATAPVKKIVGEIKGNPGYRGASGDDSWGGAYNRTGDWLFGK